jgi:uncharacterized protein involved in response to NO
MLAAADITWWIGQVWPDPPLQARALQFMLNLFTLLLLVVGGRALRAATGGYLERRGIARRDRKQRHIEFPLAALLIGVALADLFAINRAAGLLSLLAALLVLIRIFPWQLHRTFSHAPLWTLTLGYLWLPAGLFIKGVAQLYTGMTASGMLHGISAGALGTLTLVMMARTASLRTHRPILPFGDIGIATVLLSLATLGRLTAPLIPSLYDSLLYLAATGWGMAFMILLVRLLRASPVE